MKSVRIWSLSGPYFPAVELNTERYPVYLECGKTRVRKTPNTDTFHAINCRFTYAGNWELLKPIAGQNLEEAMFVYIFKREIEINWDKSCIYSGY